MLTHFHERRLEVTARTRCREKQKRLTSNRVPRCTHQVASRGSAAMHSYTFRQAGRESGPLLCTMHLHWQTPVGLQHLRAPRSTWQHGPGLSRRLHGHLLHAAATQQLCQPVNRWHEMR
jgi:hypothetical protein